MKTFYSASDIETLVSQGVRELVMDDDIVLTAMARETATQLGVKLVTPGQRPGAPAVAATQAAPAASPLKPKGCQHHGRATASQAPGALSSHGISSRTSPIVDDLIGAVKQLAKRG